MGQEIKKNVDTFWWKKALYQELWSLIVWAQSKNKIRIHSISDSSLTKQVGVISEVYYWQTCYRLHTNVFDYNYNYFVIS